MEGFYCIFIWMFACDIVQIEYCVVNYVIGVPRKLFTKMMRQFEVDSKDYKLYRPSIIKPNIILGREESEHNFKIVLVLKDLIHQTPQISILPDCSVKFINMITTPVAV